MDSKWLEDFLSLSRHGNFSLAARERCVSQPAFSRRVKALEETFGAPLFDRTTTPVTLTRYGERFEPYARHVISTLKEAQREIAGMLPQTDNTIVMVSLHTLSINILPDMIHYLHRAYPQVSFAVNACMQGIDNHFSALLNRQIDMLVTYDLLQAQPSLETAEHLKRTVWRYERFIPVMAAPLLAQISDERSPIPWLRYSDYTFVQKIIAPAEQQVASRLKPVFESGLSESIREMVLRGMGLAWLPESMVAEELACGKLVQLWSDNKARQREIAIVIWCQRQENRPILNLCWEKLSRKSQG
ncbi:LysR family transcriptional regulator [Atlantibacter sp.]|uniref:LysR family transcriptional regulator n=1 Tax=Atlantibacter sp. TaxID=1903473 RepID=UPI00289AEA3D|nr:LysR family transcriptional regulator [Atlantibacter sp.]